MDVRERGKERCDGMGWGGVHSHHSVAVTGWYLHLPVICTGFCRVEETEREREGEENLYPLYL